MDGMHLVTRALLLNLDSLPPRARRIRAPDHVGIAPDDLPY